MAILSRVLSVNVYRLNKSDIFLKPLFPVVKKELKHGRIGFSRNRQNFSNFLGGLNSFFELSQSRKKKAFLGTFRKNGVHKSAVFRARFIHKIINYWLQRRLAKF